MNWHLRTIGMGSPNYRLASRRLAREASQTGLFTTSIGFTESGLQRLSPRFWIQHKSVLKSRTPGFGWWVWKPYFILESLLLLPDGDGLLYLDAGCVIKNDEASLNSIKDQMRMTKKQSVSGSNSDFYEEQRYTSNDLLDHLFLTVLQRSESQYCAAILYIINNQEGREFLREWCRLVCVEDHRWLLPVKFSTANHPSFRHHMHDQASLSCLLKSKNKMSVSTGNKTVDGAIRLARHRFGYSFYEQRWYVRFPFEMLHIFTRLNLALQRRIFRKALIRRPIEHPLFVP